MNRTPNWFTMWRVPHVLLSDRIPYVRTYWWWWWETYIKVKCLQNEWSTKKNNQRINEQTRETLRQTVFCHCETIPLSDARRRTIDTQMRMPYMDHKRIYDCWRVITSVIWLLPLDWMPIQASGVRRLRRIAFAYKPNNSICSVISHHLVRCSSTFHDCANRMNRLLDKTIFCYGNVSIGSSQRLNYRFVLDCCGRSNKQFNCELWV